MNIKYPPATPRPPDDKACRTGGNIPSKAEAPCRAASYFGPPSNISPCYASLGPLDDARARPNPKKGVPLSKAARSVEVSDACSGRPAEGYDDDAPLPARMMFRPLSFVARH
jgi:hypothetical protein